MSYTLSEPPKQTIRDRLYNDIVPGNIQGYDPTQTDTTADDFLPIVTDWPGGDTYPIISCTDTTGNVVGGGDLPFSGIAGDGSGVTQEHVDVVSITIQASGDVDYLGGLDKDAIAWELSQECQRVINSLNFNAPNDSEYWAFAIEGFTDTTDSSDASGFTQLTGDVSMQYQLSP